MAKMLLCIMLIMVNLLYTLFIIGEIELFFGRFVFNIIYAPGIIFTLLIFPSANFILWKVKERVMWFDYSLLVLPLILWLLILPGGSFTKFLFINFPLTWTVSFLYLFRFSNIAKDNIYYAALFCWILIIMILFLVNTVIPILPE